MRLKILVLALLVLAGCRGEVRTDLNISTVSAVEAGQTFKVPARLSMDVGSTAACEANQISLMIALDSGFGDSRFLACRKDRGTVFADFRVMLPVTADRYLRSPLFLAVGSDNGQTVVSIRRDHDRVYAMQETLPRTLRRALDQPIDAEIEVRLHNDSGQAKAVSVPAAVVNGRAQTQPGVVGVARGGRLTVTLAGFGASAPSDSAAVLFWWPAP